MKILITGSSGVIGKFLSKKLKDHDVYVPKKDIVDFTNKDHVDKLFNSHSRFNLIIHCAVRGGNRLYHDSWDVLDDNLKMYYNILNHKNSFDKFITFGSGAEIYLSDTPYGLSKKAIAKSILDQFNFYNIRIFSLFGEGELDSRFIRANLQRYKNKQDIEIYQNRLIDFFYMEDLWTVVKYYIETQFPPKEINCSYKESMNTELLDIAKFINTLDKHTVDIIIKDSEYGSLYIGNPCSLDLKYIGLKQGIINEYNKLQYV
jgi:nucleoside-diphosphate-sugar epimerase